MKKHQITFELKLPDDHPSLEALHALAKHSGLSFDDFLTRSVLTHSQHLIESLHYDTTQKILNASRSQTRRNESLLAD